MLTRQDLEDLNWMISRAKKLADGEVDYAVYEPGGAIVGEFFGRVGPDEVRPARSNAALASAAPPLALACLESLRVFRMQAEDGGRGERASLEPIIEQLETVLATAGVTP